MQNFEYIDVAENAIRALEKISEGYGGAILSTGGLDLMINMIDFFVVSIQVIRLLLAKLKLKLALYM